MRLIVIALLVLSAAVAALLYAVFHMPGKSRLVPPSSDTATNKELQTRLEEHVRHLAEDIGERHFRRPGSLERTAQYIERQFSALGYSPRRLPYQIGNQTFHNLEVEITGKNRPEEIVVLGAHYDTVPGSPGADDNASGIAALIELARLVKGVNLPKTLRLVAFVNEEEPFHSTGMGSGVYAQQARAQGLNITATISLESIGYYDNNPGSQHYPEFVSWFYPDTGSFIAFVGNLKSRSLVHQAIASFRKHSDFPSQGLAGPDSLVPDIGRSDHSSFWRSGYQGIMITDTVPFRNPHYHRPSDAPDTLRFDYMSMVVSGVYHVIIDLCG